MQYQVSNRTVTVLHSYPAASIRLAVYGATPDE
jgi:hypothetical protein